MEQEKDKYGSLVERRGNYFKSPAFKMLLKNVTTTSEIIYDDVMADKNICKFCGEQSLFCYDFHAAFINNDFGFNAIVEGACCKKMEIELEKCRKSHIKEYIKYCTSTIDKLSTPVIYRDFTMSSLKEIEQHKKAEKQIRDYFKKGLKEKLGVYIFSKKNGTGKTATACIICKTACAYLGYRKYEFMNYPEFVSKYEQASFEDKEDLLNIYKRIRILLIDDLGKGRSTVTSISNIYDIINTRNNNRKITIFTSNLSITEISKSFDSSVASRLFEMTEIIEMGGKDLRLTKEQFKIK